MAEVHYFILCDSAMLDPATGKVNILGTFRRIYAPRFPCTHQQCALAFEVVTDQGEHTFGIRLTDTNEQDLIPPTGIRGRLKSDGVNPYSSVVNLVGLQFMKEGIYTFVLEIDGRKAGEIDFHVSELEKGSQP